MKKYINKYTLSYMIMFYIIILSVSMITSTIKSAEKDVILENNLMSNQSKILFNESSKLTPVDIYNAIKQVDNIMVKINNVYIDKDITATALYFNYSPNIKYPMIYGNFFTNEDFINELPIAIIGKGIIDKTHKRGDNHYIKYGDDEYMVKGIIGYEKRSLKIDNMIILNASYLLKNSNDNNIIRIITVDSKQDTPNKVSDIVRYIKSLDNDGKYTIHDNIIQKSDILSFIDIIPNIGLEIISIFFINVIIINVFWIKSRKKEISIKKAIGASNKTIFLEIMIVQQILVLITYTLAMLTHYVLVMFTQVPILNLIGTEIYYSTTIATLVLSCLIGICAIIPQYFKIIKVDPALSLNRWR